VGRGPHAGLAPKHGADAPHSRAVQHVNHQLRALEIIEQDLTTRSAILLIIVVFIVVAEKLFIKKIFF
jgi:hypothetical protein